MISNLNEIYLKSILVKINDCGAFLIRPQSKKTSSNDHDYVRIKKKTFFLKSPRTIGFVV
jgi:hypothetical protein